MVMMTKNWKKFTVGNLFKYSFDQKISITFPKGRPSYRRSIQPQF
jgi:hypothetical protein